MPERKAPGGLRDLADALTVRFDPYVADDALRRVGNILTVQLTGRSETIFKGWNLPKALGEVNYWTAVGKLWSALAIHSFEEFVPPTGQVGRQLVYAPHEAHGYRRVIPRYFEDRAELIALLRETVETMFAAATAAAGKSTWAEKTPFNLLAMPFLWELFPEAAIVHVKRHPLRVVASHLDQVWAPRDLDGVLAWLMPVYQRWLAWKASFDFAPYRFIEVSVEELAQDWPTQRRHLFEQLGLEDVVTTTTFEVEAVEHRDNQLDSQARASVAEALGNILPAMGYQ